MSQWQSITKLANDVQSGRTSASALVDQALQTIEDKKEFNAVIVSITERARERAKNIDNRVTNGETIGRLAGVPFIAKDNFLTFGSDTTAASNILKGFKAPYQSTAIERLEAEGAICVAKANLDAFAHGSSTENSDFMTTKNPHDPTRVPGGSSGGSAAAVILDMAPFALGTDTGGSIRLPASFCGAVGYKPTYGLVSRSGVVAMASSTDVIGPLTRTVEDAALVLDVMAGKDALDSTTIDRDPTSYQTSTTNYKLANAKIGVIREYMAEGLDPGVKKQIENAIEKLKVAGATVSEISLPSLPLALACYYIIMPAEVSSNLSRYDGQRYGFSHPKATSLDDSYNWSRTEGFGREAKRRIMIGTYVLSSGYYDAYYKKAQQLRTKLIDEFSQAFRTVDFMIGPTAPTPAFEIGQNISDPLKMYLTDIMTVAANLVGLPAISIPIGQIDGLPIGLQLMAAQNKDRHLLGLAKATEGILS
ncbi:Asp-tRNA(Asn)/Glu-tRNA(Gln) amidotransferase subunit GatA [Candidatus Saccharibacteria bacterium]|nr:Asp-tRNA(Asn)/Glu-tRNA(Gln) amidotransferase subunit GatA [Candidatus Saccharibacteria bacterium]MBI3338090.1 Asp-tRNA(Asn)/Glu-tRNA(Gln) amidotransferase subunit GatA [Candidatus Saccharibacteria bacterium]